MSRWYQARMVSGLAPQATFSRALVPSRLAISASVHRSASDRAAVLASGPGEFGSLQPGIHSAAAVPGLPARLHTPADEPTDCRSCELSIIAGLVLSLFEYFDHSGVGLTVQYMEGAPI